MLNWLRTTWMGRGTNEVTMAGAVTSPEATTGDATLAAEFAARGPWVTRFWIDGAPYGGPHDLSRDPRLTMAEAALGGFAGKRVLELGALEGGHSIALAARGATVVALEGRPANCDRARWVAARLGADGVRFVVADVRSADFSAWGAFDLVLNSGLLYHLDAPWTLLSRLAPVAPLMFVWTHFVPDGEATERVAVPGGVIAGVFKPEYGLADPLSGLEARSFWPTREGLWAMLAHAGFTVRTADIQPDHRDGPAVTLVAARTEAA